MFLLLVTHTPASDFSKALGVALPLDGRHAWVFYDRVRRSTQDDRQTSALLAHVMAHEIAHVLQGIVRHSDEGILKARWSPTDVSRMADFPLMFTSADAILIRRGVEERHLRLLSKGPAGEVPIPLALPNKTGFLPLR